MIVVCQEPLAVRVVEMEETGLNEVVKRLLDLLEAKGQEERHTLGLYEGWIRTVMTESIRVGKDEGPHNVSQVTHGSVFLT